MGLFRISRELQFRVSAEATMCKSPHGKGRRCFYRGDRGGGGLSIQSPAFHWLSPGRKEGESFFFLLGLAVVARVRAPPAGLPTLFNWGFCSVMFYTSMYESSTSPASSSAFTLVV